MRKVELQTILTIGLKKQEILVISWIYFSVLSISVSRLLILLRDCQNSDLNHQRLKKDSNNPFF